MTPAPEGTGFWLELEESAGRRRVDLPRGLTRIGGAGCDLVLERAGDGELHFWSDPPKLLHGEGASGAFSVNGEPREEAELADGDRVAWGAARFTFRGAARGALLEEIPLPAKPAAVVRPAAERARKPAAEASGRPAQLGELRLSRLLRAGLLAELGLADATELERAQQAVMRREFSADAAANAILAKSTVGADDPRLSERTERLLRDLVMSPLQTSARRAGRRMRGAVKSGAALAISQLIVIAIYTALILLAMIVVRAKLPEFSFDTFLERLVPWSLDRGR